MRQSPKTGMADPRSWSSETSTNQAHRQPGPVQVQAAGAHRGDWHVMTRLPYMIRLAVPTLGLRKPKSPCWAWTSPDASKRSVPR
jgi:hypothetical protein